MWKMVVLELQSLRHKEGFPGRSFRQWKHTTLNQKWGKCSQSHTPPFHAFSAECLLLAAPIVNLVREACGEWSNRQDKSHGTHRKVLDGRERPRPGKIKEKVPVLSYFLTFSSSHITNLLYLMTQLKELVSKIMEIQVVHHTDVFTVIYTKLLPTTLYHSTMLKRDEFHSLVMS